LFVFIATARTWKQSTCRVVADDLRTYVFKSFLNFYFNSVNAELLFWSAIGVTFVKV